MANNDPRGLIPLIRETAIKYGIDPDVAVKVAESEGLNQFTSGIKGENSFGAFQLNTQGGLGNEFQKSTGLDPSDPQNEPATIDYALRHASQSGWGAFHGAKNRYGWGPWVGIAGKGGSAMSGNMDPTLSLDQLALAHQGAPPMNIDPATASSGGAAGGGLFGHGGGILGLGPQAQQFQQHLAQQFGGAGTPGQPQAGNSALGLLAASQPHAMQQQQAPLQAAPGHQPSAQMAMPQINYGPQQAAPLGALGGMASPMSGGTDGTGGSGGTGSGDPRLLGILRQYGLV